MSDGRSDFKDHFSTGSDGYACYRPSYPDALFASLANLAPHRDRAWDCATGSGQAAIRLAAHFAHVDASDASAEQIAHAQAHPRITYRVEPAEASSLASDSVALVTVAQALHWLDLSAFYAEARRVCCNGGLVAAFTYALCRPCLPTGGATAEASRILDGFYLGEIHPYWPPERVHVESGYRSLPFPFEPVEVPRFAMEADWSLLDLLGYLRTWSAVTRFRQDRGRDPVQVVETPLASIWGGAPEQRRRIQWPLSLRVGRVS